MYWSRVIYMLIGTVIIVCLWCRSTIADTVDFCPQVGAHEFESHILVQNSEKSEGQVENICVHCGYTYIEYLPATGHVYGEWQLVGEQDGSGARIERRECLQCHGDETRVVTSVPEPEPEPDPEPAEPLWYANEMDYVLSTSIGGLWGYAVLVLWYNSLVLNWYKRECRKNLKKEIINDGQ